MVVDTIHAICFDALSNPLKQPCLSFPFFSLPLPSNRSSREKLFHYFHPFHESFSLLRIRFFLAREKKDSAAEKGKGREGDRISLPHPRWNIQRLFVRAGIPMIRNGTEFTRWTVFAVVERVWKGRSGLNLYLPWSRGKGEGTVIFRRGCVYEHTCPHLLLSSYKYDACTTRPLHFDWTTYFLCQACVSNCFEKLNECALQWYNFFPK